MTAPDVFLTRSLAASLKATNLLDEELAKYLDKSDPLCLVRDQFHIPQQGSSKQPAVYMSGHSLGLMPKLVRKLVDQELEVWANSGVNGHFDHPYDRPWRDIGDVPLKTMASLVGAQQREVACMGTLTANIHMLLASFYKPLKTRYRILFEQGAFPSDTYAFTSQARLHDLDPDDTLIQLAPRAGEYTLRTADILQTIASHGQSIAVIMFSGLQYYTGQCFDMAAITKAGQEQGCLVGFDLAHAIGNVPLQLHDWNVDFAAWCTYKYLNSGPGGIAGIFIHERHADPTTGKPRMSGWWGHNPVTRFDMPATFDPTHGAAGYQVSNPSVLATVSLCASLQVFQACMSNSNNDGLAVLRQKSERMTTYMEKILMSSRHFIPTDKAAAYDGQPAFTIITPSKPAERGAQLSLLFLPVGSGLMMRVFGALQTDGVVPDERKPDVIRIAPVPLYNSYMDVRKAALSVLRAMDKEFAA